MTHVQNVKIWKGQGKYQNENVGILMKEIKYQLPDRGNPEGNSFPWIAVFFYLLRLRLGWHWE